MIDRADILDYLKQHKAELLTQYKLSKIGIFGSFARAEQTADSDIDLIVEFQDGTENLFQLKQGLKKLMEQRFGREVDICREKYVKAYFKRGILGEAVFV
jgi:predicted nucleotidyltransferase